VSIVRWNQNPWTWGSYPHLRPGCPADAIATLAKPLNKRVFFAGDGTHVDYYGTAHGALLSGQRAAGEVAQVRKAAKPNRGLRGLATAV